MIIGVLVLHLSNCVRACIFVCYSKLTRAINENIWADSVAFPPSEQQASLSRTSSHQQNQQMYLPSNRARTTSQLSRETDAR